MSEQKGFMGTLQRVLVPIGSFLSSQKHFASISAGLQATVGISIVAAFIQIISTVLGMFEEGQALANTLNFSIPGVENITEVLNVPYDMIMGLLGIVAAFAIAYNLSKYYKMNQLTSGLVSMLSFLLVVAPVQDVVTNTIGDDGENVIFKGLDFTWLGASGLFTAIIVALLSVEITYLCVRRHWIIKMPDVVPPFLQDSFNSMIPLVLNVVVFHGVNTALAAIDPELNIAAAINALLMSPLQSIVGSVPGMFVIITFALLLWTVGVHGTMIVYPIILPITIPATLENAELVANGQSPVFNAVFLFTAVQLAGGTGNTLSLAFITSRFAKSEQLKAIGKASFVPGIFGVNEPMIFGAPIVFNPLMAIPFILSGPIVALLMWGCLFVGYYYT